MISTLPQSFSHAIENPFVPKTYKESVYYESLLREYFNNYGGVGASVAIIDKNQIHFFSCGKKSLDSNVKPTEQTLFEMGSITKVFTTLLLDSFAERGKLKLDDPIQTYIPSIIIPEVDGKQITFRHLATHYSGLPELPNNLKSHAPNPYQFYSLDDLKYFLSDCCLESAPGDSFLYSDLGMGLLAFILCQIEGKSFDELLLEYIFNPLDMRNSGILDKQTHKENFSTGYAEGGKVEHFEMAEIFQGAGSLYSNTKDMTRFLAANMGLIESSVTNLLTDCHCFQGTSFPTMNIGLGWLVAPDANTGDIIWHSGKTGGFRSFLGFNAKTRKGIVILANSIEDWPRLLALRVLNEKF